MKHWEITHTCPGCGKQIKGNAYRRHERTCRVARLRAFLRSQARLRSRGARHHAAGPSTLPRLYLCPASLRLSEGLSRDSAAADAGVDFHREVARRIVGGEPRGYFSDFEEEAIKRAVMVATEITEGYRVVDCELPLEVYDEGLGEILSYGTADLVAVDHKRRRAVVADWKFYRVPSTVSTTGIALQGGTYGCSLLSDGYTVRLVVYNPFTSERWETVLTPERLPSMLKTVRETIEAALDPKAEPKPSLEACAFCPAKGVCPARDEALAVVPAAPDGLGRIPPARLVAEISRLKLAKSFVDEALDCAKTALHENEDLSSEWYVKESAGRRKVRDLGGAVVQFRLPLQEVLQSASISVSELERIAKQHDVAPAALEPYVETGKPGLRLLPRPRARPEKRRIADPSQPPTRGPE